MTVLATSVAPGRDLVMDRLMRIGRPFGIAGRFNTGSRRASGGALP